MERRDFLRTAGMATAAWAALKEAGAEAGAGGTWRSFEVVTRVEVLAPDGATRVWVPTPLDVETPYQRPLGTTFDAGAGQARLVAGERPAAVGMVAAEFPAGAPAVLVVRSKASTRDHTAVAAAAGAKPREERATLEHFLRPSRLIPTDGIVSETALRITAAKASGMEKARALYEWVVENTFRDPKVRGCGVGDIASMLKTGNLGGKCADLNALYVGLARAAGLPARDAYGIRVAKSELGYKSLGTASPVITKSQHCRAEVYVEGHGWLPVDPADVRKVALEEPPGNRPLDDDTVKRARARLFGSWEMNWLAYNFGHDVALPGSQGEPLGFFMYPQVETGGRRRDPLDPDAVKYEITSSQLG